MSSQVERGTVREMVHTIAFHAGVLERILQEPVYGSLEVRMDELAHVQLLQRQIDDLRRYLSLPSVEPERIVKVELNPLAEDIVIGNTTYKVGTRVIAECECGTWLRLGYKYCPNCGVRLEWE